MMANKRWGLVVISLLARTLALSEQKMTNEEIIMPSLAIVRLGHPALRIKSTPVTGGELKSGTFQKFLDDLAQTCLQSHGAGIAAPQVGINKRIIVMHVDPNNPRYPNRPAFPLTIIINPEIVSVSSGDVEEDWEGDLSANIRALVPRAKICKVRGVDREGLPVEYDLSGFHARVFQHEMDHLDGVFLIDKVNRKETISELPEWEKFWKGKDANTVISSYSAKVAFDIPEKR